MLTGLFVPLITPYAESGEVALDALTELALDVLRGGATGLVALGTTGEPFALSAEERQRVIDVCDRVCREHSAPLIVGTGTPDTSTTVESLVALKQWPSLAAALVPVPYYTVPSVEGIVAHFTRAAAESPVPLVIYNIPHRAGARLPAPALLELAAMPGIVGVKHSVGGFDPDTAALLAATPPGFSILGGDDAVAPALLALGAAGSITASAQVSTPDYVAMVAAFRAGDLDQGRALAHRLVALSTALFAEPNPTVIKGVLHAQGRIPTPAVRLPLLPAHDTSVHAALRALRRAPTP